MLAIMNSLDPFGIENQQDCLWNTFVADWLQFGFGFGISPTLQKIPDLHLAAKFLINTVLWMLSN
jgi:hypothetical protein